MAGRTNMTYIDDTNTAQPAVRTYFSRLDKTLAFLQTLRVDDGYRYYWHYIYGNLWVGSTHFINVHNITNTFWIIFRVQDHVMIPAMAFGAQTKKNNGSVGIAENGTTANALAVLQLVKQSIFSK